MRCYPVRVALACTSLVALLGVIVTDAPHRPPALR
jgi:hypothetical protein